MSFASGPKTLARVDALVRNLERAGLMHSGSAVVVGQYVQIRKRGAGLCSKLLDVWPPKDDREVLFLCRSVIGDLVVSRQNLRPCEGVQDGACRCAAARPQRGGPAPEPGGRVEVAPLGNTGVAA